MPRGDRTGPMGMGPMTGRGAGFCGGNAGPGFMSQMPGRGAGFGRCRGGGFGMGRGWKHTGNYYGYRETASQVSAVPVDELSILKGQATYFGQALASVTDRISELEEKNK